MTIRIACWHGQGPDARPCMDDRCPKCHGRGLIKVSGLRGWIIALLGGLT